MNVLKNSYDGKAVEAALQFVAMGTAGILGPTVGRELLEQMPEDLGRLAVVNTRAAIESGKLAKLGMSGCIIEALTEKLAKLREEAEEKEAKEEPKEEPKKEQKEELPKELKEILTKLLGM